MRLAEYAHRTRPKGPHHRKAPPGADRPAYFIHLAEVGWLLQDAGLDPETVAAGYLHDIIEDCDYTEGQLAREIGSARVAELVSWVSEIKRDPQTGAPLGWDVRIEAYLERIKAAPPEAVALSCADKIANMADMTRIARGGFPVDTYTARNHDAQRARFEALGEVFRERGVPPVLYNRFEKVFAEFCCAG